MTVPNSVMWRIVGALLFIIGGGALILMSLLGAPSLWYVLCFCALPIVGIIWIWRPRLAAALSIGPLISVGILLGYVSGMWSFSRFWAGAVILGLIAALVLVSTALRGFAGWRLPVVVSLAFVCVAFATDRLFTNKVTVAAHEMYFALDGHAPWGEVGPEWLDGSAPVVVYRRIGNGYCYEAFRSEELRQRLAPKAGRPIIVEYNVFSDFGKERSYNVRSVDGLLLNDATHAVRGYEQFGGEILDNNGTTARTANSCP